MKCGPLPARSKALYKEPLRTCTELAEEFGITPNLLGNLLRNDASAPKGIPNHNGTSRAVYRYPLHTTRRWWASKGIKK